MQSFQAVPHTSLSPRPDQNLKTNAVPSVPQPAPERLAPERLAPERLAPERLAPATWLRVVAGFDKPFGRDGMPTVWG